MDSNKFQGRAQAVLAHLCALKKNNHCKPQMPVCQCAPVAQVRSQVVLTQLQAAQVSI
jgi:hypothetical protein